MDKLFLLDAYALIYRAYYAFIKNPRINSKGLNTSAVMGFVNTLLEIISKEHPTHIGVAFDHGKTFRNDAFPNIRHSERKHPKTSSFRCPSSSNYLKRGISPVCRSTASKLMMSSVH